MRQKEARKWNEHESALLDSAVESFKIRCMQEAERQLYQASISFEVLTRDVPNFPSLLCKDSVYVVDSWGDGAASWWYYAHKGCNHGAWTPGTPVPFAELLESMMPKFVEKVKALGFERCER